MTTRSPGTAHTRATSPAFLSIADVAATTGFSESGIAEAIRTGKLPSLRISDRMIVVPREALWTDEQPGPLTFDDRLIARAVANGLESVRAARRELVSTAEQVGAALVALEEIEAVLDRKAGSAPARKAA